MKNGSLQQFAFLVAVAVVAAFATEFARDYFNKSEVSA